MSFPEAPMRCAHIALFALLALAAAKPKVVALDDGVEIELSLPALDTVLVSTDYGEFVRLRLSGAQYTVSPGEPMLPVEVLVVGIPPDGQVKVEYEVLWDKELSLSHPVLPADSVFWCGAAVCRKSVPPKPRIYRRKGFAPREAVVFEHGGWMRSQRIGRVVVFPVSYDPSRNVVRAARSVRVRLRFKPSGRYVDEGGFEQVFRAMLLNYDQAKRMRLLRETVELPENVFSHGGAWYRVALRRGGVFALTASWLSEVGISADAVDPNDVRVFEGPPGTLPLALGDTLPSLVEVPALFVGDDDGSFDEGDTLIFYAPGPECWTVENCMPDWKPSPYNDSVSVWICVGGDFPSPPKRLSPLSFAPADTELSCGWTFVHIGQDEDYDEGFGWFWQKVFGAVTVFVTDPRIVPGRTNGYICTYPSYGGVRIEVGGTSYGGSCAWVDELVPGANPIRIVYPDTVFFKSVEAMYLVELAPSDGFLEFLAREVDGAVRFLLSGFQNPVAIDITDIGSARELEVIPYGGGFAFVDSIRQRECRKYVVFDREAVRQLPTGTQETDFSLWEAPTDTIDYIIISPSVFDPTALADFWSARGIRTEVVWLEDVMRQFGFGRYDPTAIRNFLCYLYNVSDPPRPQYVLFVGDGHYDYRHILTDAPNYFPPAMEAAYQTDAFYVTISDGGEVELMSGRLPVRSQSELDAVVEKITGYADCAPFGEWRLRAVMSADDEYRDDGRNDNLSYTTSNSELIESFLPPQVLVCPVYLVDFPRTPTLHKPAAKAALLEGVNEGAVWVNWIGHGNYHLWAHERLLDFPGDLPSWRNGQMLPFVSAFSCEGGLFYVGGGWECRAVEVCPKRDGGAIAVLAATAGSYAGNNQHMNERLVESLFGDEAIPISGAAIAARSALYPNHDSQYILMGDPATVLAYPYGDVSLSVAADSGETLRAASWMVVSGNVPDIDHGTAKLFFIEPNYYKHYDSPIIPSSCDYVHPGRILFAGAATISNHSFELRLFVPSGLTYEEGYRVVCYAYGSDGCVNASGAATDIAIDVAGQVDVVDSAGPQIEITFGEGHLAGSDTVCSPDNSLPVFVKLYDEHGINMGSVPGHGILVQLDDEYHRVDISQSLEYTVDDPTSAVASCVFEDVAYGGHTVCVQAWDNLGNASQRCVDVFLVDCKAELYDVLPYPNPFSDGVDVTFGIAGAGVSADVTLEIFTLGGRRIFSASKTTTASFDWIHWDGRAQNGREVARGVYIFVLRAKLRTADGSTTTRVVRGKIVKE